MNITFEFSNGINAKKIHLHKHAFLDEVISPQSDFGQNCPANHNANMHSLDLPCSYLQFATTNILSFPKITTIV
jgi:hypothetical protein